MKKLLYNPSQLVTVNTNGNNVKRGNELFEVESLTEHSIILEENRIKDIIPTT
ncbi:MAG: imidazolonepropionase, partial [Ignavibacteriae bacterium]